MNIEQAALEVAEEMPKGFMFYEGCGCETGVLKEEVIEFSRRLIAKLTESAEPLGYIKSDTARWLSGAEVRGNNRAETVTRIRPIKDSFLDFPLFAHPAPVPEGYALVPLWPNGEMIRAWLRATSKHVPFEWSDPAIIDGYKAMIAAAPKSEK